MAADEQKQRRDKSEQAAKHREFGQELGPGRDPVLRSMCYRSAGHYVTYRHMWSTSGRNEFGFRVAVRI